MSVFVSSLTWQETLRCFTTTFLLTGIIGLDRSARNQGSGLRVHILVGLGSALITLMSFYGMTEGGRGDPARLAAQIVSGVGFLGGGAILRFGMSVRGLSTAASIWVSAAIGIACGVGQYLAAAIATAFIWFTLDPMKRIEESIRLKTQGRKIWIHIKPDAYFLETLQEYLQKYHLETKHVEVTFDADGSQLMILVFTHKPPSKILIPFLQELSKIPSVKQVEI